MAMKPTVEKSMFEWMSVSVVSAASLADFCHFQMNAEEFKSREIKTGAISRFQMKTEAI